MADLQVQVGLLVPLREDGEEDASASIPLFEGCNMVGRSNLKTMVMQVSRNHLNVHVSSETVELSVTGSNPIILKSGSDRKKLSPLSKSRLLVGDIVELLPGELPFRYISFKRETATTGVICASGNEVMADCSGSANIDTDTAKSNKRKRQIDDDEAFARALQEMENQSSKVPVSMVNASSKPREKSSTDQSALMQKENHSPCTFQLLRVQGLPECANAGCVSISDVIKGDVLVAILSNYMVDIEWLLSACPLLKTVPQVVMIHGESNTSQLQSEKPSNWLLYKPPLRLSYGTHHSKAMLLVYPTGVRVIVHTANLISVDWNNKTQGLWMQDFPFKSMTGNKEASAFENDLVEYLTALEWSGCTVGIPLHGQMKINAAYFKNFDYSNAAVRLVASVPGYHNGRHLTKWGHMKFRSILQEQGFEEKFQGSSLVYQFSSLGSLDQKWMDEFASSMCEGSTFAKKSLGLGTVQIVFPTVEDVRWSLEGYRAGNAIPSPARNVDKPFLKNYWSRWQAEHTGRIRAMPHIKTYVRYRNNSLAWFCLTSANLSKAAWGALQKNNTQLMIRSYELGVLFLPSLLKKFKNSFSCTENEPQEIHNGDEEQDVELCTIVANDVENTRNSKIFRLPVPYALPPPRYTAQDEPWSWDKQYFKPDVYGQLWPRTS